MKHVPCDLVEDILFCVEQLQKQVVNSLLISIAIRYVNNIPSLNHQALGNYSPEAVRLGELQKTVLHYLPKKSLK